jgi:hypothetical protein
MVSGRYNLDEKQRERITNWVSEGNTLITIAGGARYAISQKWVKEELLEEVRDSTKITDRKPYVDAPENIGKERVGGVILKAELDLTHPLAFGYQNTEIPVYKNNEVWLSPSKNAYSTVAKYAEDAHIDGFLSAKNRKEFLDRSASVLVSRLGKGRVVLFADNPNFRGSWYGTNRLFLNALFLGEHINVPE